MPRPALPVASTSVPSSNRCSSVFHVHEVSHVLIQMPGPSPLGSWARACLLTNPTVATTGLSLTVPLAFGSDLLMGAQVTWAQAGAAVLVVAGFLLVNITPDELAAFLKARRARTAGATD